MKDPVIYSNWYEFISNPQYSEYFLDNNTVWNNNLLKLKLYLDENKKRPSKIEKDLNNKTLGVWCNTQISKYNKKINIMKDTTIYSTWTEFINHPDYKQYFIK